MMDPYNFYYGDYGGSMATYTETGGPSIDGDGGQFYEPPMMMHSGMHPGHRNYPGERGGGYGGEDSFPGSQHQPQYRNLPYNQYQNSNYGGQEGMVQGPRGEGMEALNLEMKCNEDFMISTEQLLQNNVIPVLPNRNAAALMIEEQDRQGHGTSFATDQENLLQLGFNNNLMSSSQGF